MCFLFPVKNILPLLYTVRINCYCSCLVGEVGLCDVPAVEVDGVPGELGPVAGGYPVRPVRGVQHVVLSEERQVGTGQQLGTTWHICRVNLFLIKTIQKNCGLSPLILYRKFILTPRGEICFACHCSVVQWSLSLAMLKQLSRAHLWKRQWRFVLLLQKYVAKSEVGNLSIGFSIDSIDFLVIERSIWFAHGRSFLKINGIDSITVDLCQRWKSKDWRERFDLLA